MTDNTIQKEADEEEGIWESMLKSGESCGSLHKSAGYGHIVFAEDRHRVDKMSGTWATFECPHVRAKNASESKSIRTKYYHCRRPELKELDKTLHRKGAPIK